MSVCVSLCEYVYHEQYSTSTAAVIFVKTVDIQKFLVICANISSLSKTSHISTWLFDIALSLK